MHITWCEASCGKAAKPWKVCGAQGYFLGAFLFLGIVFSLPATLGMASLALNLPVREVFLSSNDRISVGLYAVKLCRCRALLLCTS